MTKLICYSLFGNQKKYSECLLANVEAIREIYDESWTIRVYFDDEVPKEYVTKLSEACEMIEKPRNQGRSGFFWRYAPLFETGIERFVALDADDIVSRTFRRAVDAWVESDQEFFRFKIFRAAGVASGYVGAKGGILCDISDPIFPGMSCEEHVRILESSERQWGDDEHWLTHVVFKLLRNSCYSASAGYYTQPGYVATPVVPVPADSVIRTKNLNGLTRYGGYPLQYELGMTREEIEADRRMKIERRKTGV